MTDDTPAPGGPLHGVRVIELAGLGPGPFAAMMLADLGADVIRIDRATDVRPELFGTPHPDLLNRGRRSLGVDLKHPDGRQIVLDLVRDADVLIEGFRPGVTERLGLGPADCHAVNPRLVYGRMTGWGQDGPNAPYAGHDIDYLALTGALHGIGRPGEPPVPPINLLGDFGGGGMMLALGVVCALFARGTGGTGQVVDAAIVDGVALLSTGVHALRRMGMWHDARGVNLLDGGAPFYATYECADGRYLAVGALEPRFYAELVRRTGFEPPEGEGRDRSDPGQWPPAREHWAALFRSRTRDEWAELLEHSDACVAPVLDWREAPEHPHMATRQVFVEHAGVTQPAPAPRLSRTPGAIRRPPPQPANTPTRCCANSGWNPSVPANSARAAPWPERSLSALARFAAPRGAVFALWARRPSAACPRAPDRRRTVIIRSRATRRLGAPSSPCGHDGLRPRVLGLQTGAAPLRALAGVIAPLHSLAR